MPGFPLRCLRILAPRARRCSPRAKKCSLGSRIPYVKYPCTHEGLRAAQMSVKESIRVNMTLCFSQGQAAAVYAATKGTKEPVYVSPFVGRLDDRGEDGDRKSTRLNSSHAQ